MKSKLLLMLLLTFIVLDSYADHNRNFSRQEKNNFFAWKDLKDEYSVTERLLDNHIKLYASISGYAMMSTENGKRLTTAPGNYDGIYTFGTNGKAPEALSLTGYINAARPDAQFYSAIGIGTTIELPDEWIKAFGIKFKGGTAKFTKDGIQFSSNTIIEKVLQSK